MKWPCYLWFMRHDKSKYNELKEIKAKDSLYQEFAAAYDKNPDSPITLSLAHEVSKKFALGCSDRDTPLAGDGKNAELTGVTLREKYHNKVPHIVYVSPYLRTRQTFEALKRGWPELEKAKLYYDDRVREQDHGRATLYNDWKIFFTLHPEERRAYQQDGPYDYKYAGGEHIPDVRLREGIWRETLVREFAGMKVLVITHHVFILGHRANSERWSPEQFIHVDKNEKPINCGITLYRGDAAQGRNGKLVLEYYNRKFY